MPSFRVENVLLPLIKIENIQLLEQGSILGFVV